MRGQNGVNGAKGERGLSGLTGSPGSKGMKGEKGDHGGDGSKGATGAKGETATLWCNLETENVITKKQLLTRKNIIILKPNVAKTFQQTILICKKICGGMYFPSSLEENNQVDQIMKINSVNTIWIRISDVAEEGNWLDPDGIQVLSFRNWESGQFKAIIVYCML